MVSFDWCPSRYTRLDLSLLSGQRPRACRRRSNLGANATRRHGLVSSVVDMREADPSDCAAPSGDRTHLVWPWRSRLAATSSPTEEPASGTRIPRAESTARILPVVGVRTGRAHNPPGSGHTLTVVSPANPSATADDRAMATGAMVRA